MLKNFRYDYDLVSAKINNIIYQRGKADQFIYKYEYDPDNRLLRAYSGTDMNVLQQDAGYRYYLHGPLARVELGDGLTNRIVQGMDYFYTLQGWLKGVNGVQFGNTETNPVSTDAGSDGSPLSTAGMHAQVGADALAFTLGYYKDDYLPIGGSGLPVFQPAFQYPAAGSNEPGGKALFNGNISNAVYSVAGLGNSLPMGYTYGYDQLNRLLEMRSHYINAASTTMGWSSQTGQQDYRESLRYDRNGNISSLFRNGSSGGGRPLAMDNLLYHYYCYTPDNTRKTYQPGQPLPADAWALTNQLAHINDSVAAGNYPLAAYPAEKDIDNQADNNYSYDGIGNLVKDNAEGITKIDWTVYGKIRSISKSDGTSIVYDYDVSGNRIQKQVVAGRNKTITSYIRDAQGKTIAVYSWRGRSNANPLPASAGNGLTGQTWDEQHLYGINRLGMWTPHILLPATPDSTNEAVQVGSKLFELTNHLGNVMAVISDKKLPVFLHDNPAVTDHYTAEKISAADYSPFGMQLPGRYYMIPAAGSYRYGFNGKENDNEPAGTGNQQNYGQRIYDPRVSRFLSVDPISTHYPMLTPYQFGSNSPVSGVDQDGLEYAPAGKTGIFIIDHTAVQAYADNPSVILQQKANAATVRLLHMVERAHLQPPATLSAQWQPAAAFEKERHEAEKAAWYDRDGYNADGSPTPATRLARDKTWNAFADHLALPFLDLASFAYGGGELKGLRGTVSFLEKKEFEALATTGKIDPRVIRFSQENIAANFKDGRSVNSLAELLGKGNKIDITPIRIVEKDGMVFTLDNRRLYAHQMANVEVPYIKLANIPEEELRKFSTLNNGTSITVRKATPQH